MEIGFFRDLVRQVGCQLAQNVFPNLLLVFPLGDKWVVGVRFVALFFFHQGKGQSDELVCCGCSSLSWCVFVLEMLPGVVTVILRTMRIQRQSYLVHCHSQGILPFVRSSQIGFVYFS